MISCRAGLQARAGRQPGRPPGREGVGQCVGGPRRSEPAWLQIGRESVAFRCAAAWLRTGGLGSEGPGVASLRVSPTRESRRRRRRSSSSCQFEARPAGPARAASHRLPRRGLDRDPSRAHASREPRLRKMARGPAQQRERGRLCSPKQHTPLRPGPLSRRG